MKVVVMADTHMPKRAKKLPSKLLSGLKTTDLIIHAGDWQTIDVYKELKEYAKVEGVVGNVDGLEIQEHFDHKKLLDLMGFKIGVVHGHGTKMTTEKRALAAFKDEEVDGIIFGHSHIPVLKYINGVLVFNPGSPTDKRRQPLYSYGILTIGEELRAEHIFFEDKG